jgi:integrase
MQAYRDRLDRQILPGLGQLRVRELTVGVLDRHLRLIVDKHGAATAKMCRSVLFGLCTLAACHDALERNPVRALGPVSAKAKKAPRAMTVPELRQLRAALTYDEQAIARDLPDLVSFMMATGLRIGETTGLAWDAVDLDLGTVDVRAAAIGVKGQGLVIKTTKTDAGTRTLVLPQWCITMLRRRVGALALSEESTHRRPVFPAPLGGWRDPVEHASRPTPGVRERGLRLGDLAHLSQDVASVMDQAGLSSRAAADQTRPANISMTSDVYFGRKVLATGAAAVLEALGT